MVRRSRLEVVDRLPHRTRSTVLSDFLYKMQFSCTRFLKILVQEMTKSLGGGHHATLS
jgi:hypothetical protein